MAAPDGIDWDWAVRTGGQLSARQKRQLLGPLLRLVVQYPAIRARLALGPRGTTTIDLDTLTWPDSAVARAATEEARDVLPRWLLEHSYRTYLFGLLLAKAGDVHVDEELVFVASMLHDTHLGKPTPGRCFAVVGGEHAERFVLGHGEGEAMAGAVGAAVAGHITVGALDDVADPAGFVSAGAFADLTGVGLEHTSAAWIDAVLAAHPRHGFTRKLLPTWRDEARAVPQGRARWLNRYAALPLLIRAAPFRE